MVANGSLKTKICSQCKNRNLKLLVNQVCCVNAYEFLVKDKTQQILDPQQQNNLEYHRTNHRVNEFFLKL